MNRSLFMFLVGALVTALSTQLVKESRVNTQLREDLIAAQARLDEFYDPAKHVVTLDGLKLKAIPELGDNTKGYLVLEFWRVGFTEMCQAGFRDEERELIAVGEKFLCPSF